MSNDAVNTGAERIASCREQLDGLAERSPEEQADVLEHVHEALVAELDELRRRDRRQEEAPSG